ncbi:MAG: alpha/beta hydrolase, partial [Chloroflexota bacterium]|nr:alpha/beta hydrolase [Chloroflexota bacterium]
MTSYQLLVSARRTTTMLAAALLITSLMIWAPAPASAAGGFETEDLRIESGTGADQVELDVTLYIPNSASESAPAAAIIFPHGYGGTKKQLSGQATKFAREGYFGVTYTARGFGESTGEVSINAPDYEVADARTLIDLLSERPEVLQDAPGDPRVGILGGSYG